MANNKDRYIAVAYKLYTVNGDQVELIEEAPADKPFNFISGFGTTIDAFEREVASLNQGDSFNFTLLPAEAYGEHLSERVLDLEKEIFSVNGHFDQEMINRISGEHSCGCGGGSCGSGCGDHHHEEGHSCGCGH